MIIGGRLFDPALLRPGDVLLYAGDGLFSNVIKIKTWSRYSHCEIFDGYKYEVIAGQNVKTRMSVASRDGIGVGRYALRTDGLRVVLRPRAALNIEAGRAWFRGESKAGKIDGQAYDWLGLLSFTYAKWQGKDNGKMFCSEFCVRQLRAYGFEAFLDCDADAVAPSDFAKNSAFGVEWFAEGEPFGRSVAA